MIPEGVALIQTETFRSCSELTSVILPKSLTSIHISAFENCENLSNITLPQNLSDIGKSAFSGCKKLTEITIPPLVRRISPLAFGGCESLVRVMFSEGLSHIGHSAFDGTAINELDLPESLEKIDAMSIGIHLTKITIPYHIKEFSSFDPIELSLQPNNKPLTIIIRRDGKSYAFLVDKKETARPEFWSELKSKCM